MSVNTIDSHAEPEQATPAEDPRASLMLPAFFVSAAALIIAFIDPLYIDFEPRLVETLVLNGVIIAAVWLGVLRGDRRVFSVASAVLFALVAVEATTQPSSLATPVILIWPSRILIFALVVAAWFIFMRPPSWVRRAVVAVFIPTVLILAAAVGPSLGAQAFGWQTGAVSASFPPFWLAIDSQGTVYASGLRGALIQVFDKDGNPVGTLRPALAPDPPTPGPGILPNGMEEEMIRGGLAVLPTATVIVEGAPSLAEVLNFCGVAVDHEDNLYTIDTLDSTPYKVLKFDRNGTILAKIPLPSENAPGDGCIAVDEEHIYFSTVGGLIYIMDHQGKVLREAESPFQTTNIAAAPNGKLILLAQRALATVDVATGAVTTKQVASTVPPFFAAIAVAPDGNILIAEAITKRILRLDPSGDNIIGTIGEPGTAPGQFGDINGMALDQQGRIYVADWRYRVIQRFSSDGKIDAVWWASNTENEVEPAAGNR